MSMKERQWWIGKHCKGKHRIKLTIKGTFVPDKFLIKSWWQGVAAFAHFAFFRIHFMLFILSFQTVICFSVALQKSSTPLDPDPDPQLYSEHFELLKTQTLLLCKSFGKNPKNVQEVGVLFFLTDNRRFLQVNLSYFCCSDTADLLCKASISSCSIPPAHVLSVHHTALLLTHTVHCLQRRNHPYWHLSLVKDRFRKMRLTDIMP